MRLLKKPFSVTESRLRKVPGQSGTWPSGILRAGYFILPGKDKNNGNHNCPPSN